VSMAVDGEDPVAEMMGDPDGMPDPAVFEAFMPKTDGAPDDGRPTKEAGGSAAGARPRAEDFAPGRAGESSTGAGRTTGRAGAGAIPPHLASIEVTVSVEVGRTTLPLGELLEVEPGQLFDLESLVDEPVSILVNGRPFATGEIMAVGERFGVRIVALEDPGA
ncbi:MAG: FliM/FliN family flagellar motor switch protein, partial [Thermaurantiacus sp.]